MFAVVKALLFLYCFSLRKMSSQVNVLWEDHRNDLFLNGFGGLSFLSYAGASLHYFSGILMSCGGSKLRWCKWLHCSFDMTVLTLFFQGLIPLVPSS